MAYELIRPFGPIIMKSRLPYKIFDGINEYIENFDEDPKKFPNLLLRDIGNIYLKKSFCDEIGFTNFVENMGNEYLHKVSNPHNYTSVCLNTKHKENDPDFELFEDVYAEAWVNRYYSGDYTPLHRHGSVLSGLIFLKITPELIKEQCNVEINRQLGSVQTLGKLNGKVEFVMNSHYSMCDSTWFPDQEMSIVLLFPGWLSHHTYPFKSNIERRTLSFNLVPIGEDYGLS
jgi:hypothetical protein